MSSTIASPIVLIDSTPPLSTVAQLRCRRLVHKLARSINSTTELDHIFDLAIAGLSDCLNLDSVDLLLFKSPPGSVHAPGYLNLVHINVRLVRHRDGYTVPNSYATSADVMCADSATVRPALAGEDSYLLSQCHVLSAAWQLAPYALAMVNQDFAAVVSSTLEVSPPAPTVLATLRDRQQRQCLDMLCAPARVEELLLTPIENRGKVLGYFVMQRSAQGGWRDEELGMAEIVATQVSAAILQMQTLRQVQSMVAKRTSQLQRSMAVQGKLYEQTRKQLQQLQQLNQLQDDFLSAISHELRTPLTSIRLAVQMLRRSDLPEERRQSYLDILEQQCHQEISLINDLLTLQQAEDQRQTVHFHPIDFSVLLCETVQQVETLAIAATHAIAVTYEVVNLPDEAAPTLVPGTTRSSDLPVPVPMQSEAEGLTRLLHELLVNACKYSAPEAAIAVVVHWSEPDAEVRVAIHNTGWGITAEERPHIFKKFRRGQAAIAKTIPGTGLGLALVQRLAEKLGGAIAIHSTPPADPQQPAWQTTVTVTLPQFPT